MSVAVDKVRKLLKLARDKGASQNEIEMAMVAANRIMLEHGLTESDVAERDETPHVGRWFGGADLNWIVLTSQAASFLHAVRVLRHTDQVHLAFLGRRANVEMAEAIFEYLINQIEELYLERELPRRGAGAPDFETTFKEACSARLIDRAVEISRANRLEIPPSRSLVVIDRSLEMADKFANDRGLSVSECPAPRYGSGTGTGLVDADRIKFRQEMK